MTGVWVQDRKIALHRSRRPEVDQHARLCANVSGDLAAFQRDHAMRLAGVELTSVSRECGREVEVREVADRVEKFSCDGMSRFQQRRRANWLTGQA